MNETNTNMPIHITPHHLSLSPALHNFVHEKFSKLPRLASGVLGTDIVLRSHRGTANGKSFSASARLALAGRDIHAIASHPDLYTAIVKLVSKLARCSRKRKTRLGKMPSARRRLAMDDRPRQRRGNGGQEQRVFGFRRFAPFAFHQM
jgi:putative sigma-54 modulation protein